MIPPEELRAIVEQHVQAYYCQRTKTIQNLTLTKLIERNPYVGPVKGFNTADKWLSYHFNNHLTSGEETALGNMLENLAKSVTSIVKQAAPHSIKEGVDLQWKENGRPIFLQLKSGMHWGNSNSRKKQEEQFKQLQKNVPNARCVLGICYGTSSKKTDLGAELLTGQKLWEFISGIPAFYEDIIQPMLDSASVHVKDYNLTVNRVYNSLLSEFMCKYVKDGLIDYRKITRECSGSYVVTLSE